MSINPAAYVPGFALCLLGTILLLRGLPGVLQLAGAWRWRRVSGRVLGAGVVGYSGAPGAGHGRARFQRGAVTYSYSVDGREYLGSRIAFGTPVGFGVGALARAQVAGYEPGQTVDVWVHPRRPDRSVLRRRAPSSLVIASIGAAVLALGVVAFVD